MEKPLECPPVKDPFRTKQPSKYSDMYLSSEELHQRPEYPKEPNHPLFARLPPGKPVNPLSFDAPPFGEIHKDVPVDFILPPARFSPPRCVITVVHSSSVGTCQPLGHKFL
jgi:hypothetical protein